MGILEFFYLSSMLRVSLDLEVFHLSILVPLAYSIPSDNKVDEVDFHIVYENYYGAIR